MLRPSEASIEQCRLNILAVLDHYGFPLGAPFRVLVCRPDRIIVEPGMEAARFLLRLPHTVFRTAMLDRHHHGPTAQWTMRECVPFGSMQITGHCSPARILYDDGTLPSSSQITPRDKGEVFTWELDIDHANPEYAGCQEGHQDLVHLFTGFAATVVHGCEVAYPGKTNPFWIQERLLKRGILVPFVASA